MTHFEGFELAPLPPTPGGPPPGAGAPPLGGGAPPVSPPAGTGPATALGGMAGNQMAGIEKVKLGMKALMEALPMLPLGSEVQNAITKAVQEIGKHIQDGGAGGDNQALIQQLAMMARQAKTNPQATALHGLMGGGASGGMPPPGIGPGGAGSPPMQ